jgi:hypothetical protein
MIAAMWIKTDPAVMATVGAALRKRYPREYSTPASERHVPEAVQRESILMSHTLLPDVMEPVFAAHAAMMSPDLPLTRAQHEMIATVVSAVNSCFY